MDNVQNNIRQRYEASLQVISSEKGRGVATTSKLEKGEYVCEYLGELITLGEVKRREQQVYLF